MIHPARAIALVAMLMLAGNACSLATEATAVIEIGEGTGNEEPTGESQRDDGKLDEDETMPDGRSELSDLEFDLPPVPGSLSWTATPEEDLWFSGYGYDAEYLSTGTESEDDNVRPFFFVRRIRYLDSRLPEDSDLHILDLETASDARSLVFGFDPVEMAGCNRRVWFGLKDAAFYRSYRLSLAVHVPDAAGTDAVVTVGARSRAMSATESVEHLIAILGTASGPDGKPILQCGSLAEFAQQVLDAEVEDSDDDVRPLRDLDFAAFWDSLADLTIIEIDAD